MDSVKEIISFVGAIVSLATALIPLGIYLAERKRRANASSVPSAPSELPAIAHQTAFDRPSETVNPAPSPVVDRAAIERARQFVRTPAIVMLAVGAFGLATNLFTAGVGFVDQFVTPLGITASGTNLAPLSLETVQSGRADTRQKAADDRASALLGTITLFFLSLPSAVSIWSAYSMLKLRNYGLVLAGSFAVMPGSCLCCFLGVPSGIWSIVVLLRPEVSSAFR